MIFKIQGDTLFQTDDNGKVEKLKKFDPHSNIIINLREVLKDNKEVKEKIIKEKEAKENTQKDQSSDKSDKPDKPTKKTRTKKNGV
jgi:hypothetical protein